MHLSPLPRQAQAERRLTKTSQSREVRVRLRFASLTSALTAPDSLNSVRCEFVYNVMLVLHRWSKCCGWGAHANTRTSWAGPVSRVTDPEQRWLAPATTYCLEQSITFGVERLALGPYLYL